MPRKQPPSGYYTAKEAIEKLSISEGMLYTHVRTGTLKRHVPPGRKQGFYLKKQVDALAEGLEDFFEKPVDGNDDILDRGGLVFSQATPEDMEGVYKVAVSLFGETTSAEARKPLVARCPEGNYVVKTSREGKETIVAFIHIQPLRHDRLMVFMDGKIRGKDITADDLDSFEPGRPIEVLIKSVGAYDHIGLTAEARRRNHDAFMRKLLRGTARELAKLGSKGVVISRVYATSETATGHDMAWRAGMQMFGKPLRGGRFRYVLDVQESHLMMLEPYKQALSEYQAKYN
jgi:hypothetical protein